MSIHLWVGFVDPRGRGQRGWPGRPRDEALRGARVGLIEDAGALFVDLLRAPFVHGGGSHEADPGVAVLVVVPVEELAAVTCRSRTWGKLL